ncbi:Clavaminate synthase-like protein [Guyanagaster necrorhizus]|uniref:Clavaminate synthase-like protein n=1 Tax=Guyanagaster necrorhizus TaxID=856835 RepID=A0A9P7VFU6_9AGAR|nr:Clavaminate synthase-like protein [Guyanagaster necrorhizus MCA 3950]KAG7439376.1 Clavaminate synthase-like protein [Guyanagaster necrorhizus MCA 3950]
MLSPPFPDDVPTHPLLILDYQLLKQGDETEKERLWEAARKLGFWYLKNHGAEDEASRMFEMGEGTMRLPLEEKMKYEQGDDGRSFGYKAAGSNAVDASGKHDTIEFINVSKDDALAYPNIIHRTYPSTVNTRMESTITPFVAKSVEVNDTILDIFNDKLGLPKGTLMRLHNKEEHSGSEARITKNAPGHASDRIAIGAHTDFGSLSFLHNRLGGLQVMPPGYTEWQYVKPISRHAICNVGDALSLFSGGILRSNLHRVIPPPGPQSHLERWSLVFFTRPGNSIVLRALVEDSPLIAEAVRDTPEKNFESGSTAKEWFARRVKYQRVNNRVGPETWKASRGTENE